MKDVSLEENPEVATQQIEATGRIDLSRSVGSERQPLEQFRKRSCPAKGRRTGGDEERVGSARTIPAVTVVAARRNLTRRVSI